MNSLGVGATFDCNAESFMIAHHTLTDTSVEVLELAPLLATLESVMFAVPEGKGMDNERNSPPRTATTGRFVSFGSLGAAADVEREALDAFKALNAGPSKRYLRGLKLLAVLSVLSYSLGVYMLFLDKFPLAFIPITLFFLPCIGLLITSKKLGGEAQ